MKVGLTNFGAHIVEALLPVEEDGGVRNVRLSGSTDEEYR
jgi:aldose 1-epimerase